MAIRKSSFRPKALYLRGVVVPGGKITHLPEPTFHTFAYNTFAYNIAHHFRKDTGGIHLQHASVTVALTFIFF